MPSCGGLAARWCPHAQIETGEFRGHSTRRKQLLAEYVRLLERGGCVCAAILLDADEDTWTEKVSNERSKLPAPYAEVTVIGAPARNIECWVSADVDDFCKVTGANRQELEAAHGRDPKGVVRQALRRAAGQRDVHDYVVRFVAGAPLRAWLSMSCFAAFYRQCKELAARLQCQGLPNEADSAARTSPPLTAGPSPPVRDPVPGQLPSSLRLPGASLSAGRR